MEAQPSRECRGARACYGEPLARTDGRALASTRYTWYMHTWAHSNDAVMHSPRETAWLAAAWQCLPRPSIPRRRPAAVGVWVGALVLHVSFSPRDKEALLGRPRPPPSHLEQGTATLSRDLCWHPTKAGGGRYRFREADDGGSGAMTTVGRAGFRRHEAVAQPHSPDGPIDAASQGARSAPCTGSSACPGRRTRQGR